MLRFSVSLSDESNEWVERKAESRDRSKSQIVAAVVEAARKGDVNPFGGERDRPDPDRLDRLEQLIAELERHVDTSTDGVKSSSGEERHTGAENASNAPPDISTHGRGRWHHRRLSPCWSSAADTDGADVLPEVREAVDRAAEWWGDDGRPRRASLSSPPDHATPPTPGRWYSSATPWGLFS